MHPIINAQYYSEIQKRTSEKLPPREQLSQGFPLWSDPFGRKKKKSNE